MTKKITFLLLVLSSLTSSLFPFDKWIVVTTIQYPTPQLRNMAQIPGWKLVVVGDKKTPEDWHLENCVYLSPKKQLELGYELAALLPWKHYSRKNIGYLYALEHGAKIIYETDDDNEPITHLNYTHPQSQLPALTTLNTSLNIYSYFGHSEIWPRGFPLDEIHLSDQFQVTSPLACVIGIEQGVVNDSPDVDAIFRLTQDKTVDFKAQKTCFLPKGVYCPFNSQNTFIHPIAFFTLYLPSFVSMRVCDIWRGYISQKMIWEYGASIAFSGPSAVQKRNDHCLLNDFLLEQDLYLKATPFVDYLSNWNAPHSAHPFKLMQSLYEDLVQQDFFEERELHLLKAWFNDLEKIGYLKLFNEEKNKIQCLLK